MSQKVSKKSETKKVTETAELQRKREAALWAPDITGLRKLTDFLGHVTKDELTLMRRRLAIKGASSLKKQELIDVVAAAMVDEAPAIFALLGTKAADLLRQLAGVGGVADELVISDTELEYFRARGLMFSGQADGRSIVVMPDEMVAAFQAFDTTDNAKLIQRNNEWLRLAGGFLYYYGVLRMSELVDKVAVLSKQTNLDKNLLRAVLENGAEQGSDTMQLAGRLAAYSAVLDPLKVRQEQELRWEIEWYPFTYQQVYQAGQTGYMDKPFAFKKMSKFIAEHYVISITEADMLVEDCVYAIRMGEPMGSIIMFLQDNLEIESEELLSDFGDFLMHLNNASRHWSLKGHTPDEVAAMNRQRESVALLAKPSEAALLAATGSGEIGRNDPCSCGSGKKYKKCCGR